MSSVQFHCPLCTGLFEVDESFAGMEVTCPHCEGVVAVPEMEVEAPEPPPPMAEPTAFELNCPFCNGLFQATTEMANQEVLCPHCQQAVTVPELDAEPIGFMPPPPPPPVYEQPPAIVPPPPPIQPVQVQPVQVHSVRAVQPVQSVQPVTVVTPVVPATLPFVPPPIAPAPVSTQPDEMQLPPGFSPPINQSAAKKTITIPPPAKNPSAKTPIPKSSSTTKSEIQRSTGVPTSNEQKTSRSDVSKRSSPPPTPVPEPTPPVETSALLPPGFNAPLPQSTQARAPSETIVLAPPTTPEPIIAAAAPTLPVPATSAAESLLPPGASSPISLLPPSGGDAPNANFLPPGAETLLPPGAANAPSDAERQPLPMMEQEPNTITIPGGPAGQPVKIRDREIVKTIRHKGQIVELRQLTPEEKAQRRIIRNVIMMIACLALLSLVMGLLVWKKKK